MKNRFRREMFLVDSTEVEHFYEYKYLGDEINIRIDNYTCEIER